MHDLVGAFERLNAVYQKYIESAFPLRYSNMVEERKRLFSTSDTLSQEPLLEPTPVYPSSGLRLLEAADELPPEYGDLPNIARGLLDNLDIRLWNHQWESLRTVLRDKRDLVVTTGTGSGKTECFLLPLLAELARESTNWPSSPSTPSKRKWWENDDTGWISQWAHTGRRNSGLHAIRAVVLYPLNALVEDQLRRLRQTLDSDAVLQWMDAERAGNRVTFGRYTGATPVSGSPDNERAVERLRERLLHIAEESAAVRADDDLPIDVRHYFPNIDGGEMWSRWDMQDTPPDILITNYHMLNIMLMRQVEAGMFEQTKAWLESDSANKFFLVVDELHSYRGTPGTEVAYILRLLLDRLGLSPESPQLVILATSASVTDTSESRKFLREFFGRDNFAIISEGQVKPEQGSHKLMRQFRYDFERFARKVQPDVLIPMEPPAPDSDKVMDAMSELVDSLHPSGARGSDAAQDLAGALVAIKADQAVRDACIAANTEGEVRATRISKLARILFAGENHDESPSDAMRGLLLALGMSSKEIDGTSAQPVRGHFFFHNVQNMWVCIDPSCNEIRHVEALKSADTQFAKGPVGALHTDHRITCTCGGRVLDLLVCEVCGDILLGGYRGNVELSGQQVEILTADIPSITDLPDRASGDRKYDQYAVFWPLGMDEPDAQPEDEQFSHDRVPRRWRRAKLNVRTGRLFPSDTGMRPMEISGWIYSIGSQESAQLDALPPKCPRCDADYRRRQYATPLRMHRTGFQKACQVVAAALAREMPLESRNKPARKLLIFTDSRQDAAKLASGMEQDHYRDMVRILLLKALDEYWQSFEAALRHSGRLAGGTEKYLEVNDQLEALMDESEEARDQELASQFDPRLNSELLIWLLGGQSIDPSARQTLLDMMLDYPGRVPLTRIRDIVKQEFLRLGFNPGGNGYRLSQFVEDGNPRSWTECYEWAGDTPREKSQLPDQAQRLLGKIDDSLTSEIMFTLFQHSTRTLEGLGAAWATFRPTEAVEDGVENAVDSIIRQMGVRRRYPGQPHFFGADSIPQSGAPLSRAVRTFLESAVVSELQVMNTLRTSNVGVLDGDTLGISPASLYIRRGTRKNSAGQTEGWCCPRCSAFYLHPTGRVSVCPDCKDVPLQPDVVRETFDYYLYLAEQSGPAFRLHCEELTGQTDDSERHKRQRWFQEVFIENEKDSQRVNGVDLLSVTTTMEAGVDIGGLDSVMMANMPPRRFNYQQRVGRAGRRGAGVALAVTFCRGRSHDDYYYQRPEQITGDPPPSPYVDMSSDTIIRRVFVKEILRIVFRQIGAGGEEGFRDSVHGEFGATGDWQQRSDAVSDWLNDSPNETHIRGILEALCVGTIWQGDVAKSFQDEMLAYARNELVIDISYATSNSNNPREPLSECLAHAGLLPMFGFPTNVRQIFTRRRYSRNPWPPLSGTIDRQLDIAISQFAPGSQLVKDKAVHTAYGVATLYPFGNGIRMDHGFDPPLTEDNTRLIGVCQSCGSVQYRQKVDISQPCEVCDSLETEIIDAREPRAFFTDFDPQDYNGVFEWTPRATLPTLAWKAYRPPALPVANCDVVRFTDDIISINDNGGRGGFDFQKATVRGFPNSEGAYAVDPGRGEYLSVSGPERTVALLSQRKTDVLLASIRDWPMGIFADPRNPVGRAAWYSLSFFLRSSAAAMMDVDTLEFNAGFRPIREQDGRVVGQVFLSDTLDNGAGYCHWLGEPVNFARLLSEGDFSRSGTNAEMWLDAPHGKECDTSCNRCLRDFYNLPYHGLLDWRLAIEMTLLALNPSADIDMETPWHTADNPWWSLTSGENSPVGSTLENLGYHKGVTLSGLTAYKHQVFDTVSIVRHPLWTDEHPVYQAAKLEAEQIFQKYTVKALNPFEIIRRPASVLARET